MAENRDKAWLLDVVDPSEVVVVVLGGGRGSRLYPLTRDRAKPAVGFGGKYRLIDITLTNCLRSRFNRIFILTQFNSFSLNRHIWQTYSREMPRDGFVDVVAAEQTMKREDWFQGTADAVRQSLRHVLRHKPRYVLILSGDQIYSMDYRSLLLWHQTQHADATIAAHYSAENEISALGVVKVTPNLDVAAFCEKPQNCSLVSDFRLDNATGLKFPKDKPFLGSMGLYLFETSVLVDALEGEEADFGRGLIPKLAGRIKMSCYPFDGYWKDVGTVQAFYEANMDWRAGGGIADMFQGGASIITHSRQLPPSRIQGTAIEDSLIADGCSIAAKAIARSVIGVRSRIGTGSIIEDSIIMGNDDSAGAAHFEIGANVTIRGAIVDKNVVIGDGAAIENAQAIPEADTSLYTIRSGIVIIPKGTAIPPGARI